MSLEVLRVVGFEVLGIVGVIFFWWMVVVVRFMFCVCIVEGVMLCSCDGLL